MACDSSGAVYLESYQFPEAAKSSAQFPSIGRTTSKGTCTYTCDDGFSLPLSLMSPKKACGAAGIEPDNSSPQCSAPPQDPLTVPHRMLFATSHACLICSPF